MTRLLVALLLAAAALPAFAKDAQPTDQDPVAAGRAVRLAEQLRCLVCQNQSLEDSHASLANDLKKEVLVQMRTGASDERIIEYLVQRYGDFVRYRPSVKLGTWLLWLGPALLLIGGGAVAWKVVRRHGGPLAETGSAPTPAPHGRSPTR